MSAAIDKGVERVCLEPEGRNQNDVSSVPRGSLVEWNERRVSAAIDKGVERVRLEPEG